MAQLRRLTLLVTLLTMLLAGDLPRLAGQVAAFRPVADQGAVWNGHGQRAGIQVRITGTVAGPLSPGVSVPIEIGLRHPYSHALRLRRVKVSILGIVAPYADAAHPCTPADFSVRQMRRGVLRVPAQRYVDLRDLGLPTWLWPRMTMKNRPVNQDGCKGASLRLRYRARRARGPA